VRGGKIMTLQLKPESLKKRSGKRAYQIHKNKLERFCSGNKLAITE
jgi:hypothetical protein